MDTYSGEGFEGEADDKKDDDQGAITTIDIRDDAQKQPVHAAAPTQSSQLQTIKSDNTGGYNTDDIPAILRDKSRVKYDEGPPGGDGAMRIQESEKPNGQGGDTGFQLPDDDEIIDQYE